MSQVIGIIIEFDNEHMNLIELKKFMYTLRDIITWPTPGMTKEMWEKYKPGNWAVVGWVNDENNLKEIKDHPMVRDVIEINRFEK
jgi:hypothetical protein